jgi:hypothetical protein
MIISGMVARAKSLLSLTMRQRPEKSALGACDSVWGVAQSGGNRRIASAEASIGLRGNIIQR